MLIIKKLLFLLSANEQKRMGLLVFLILIMAFLDMIGVASILPFISVLVNPELVETNIILKNMFEISRMLGVENNQQFLFLLGVLIFLFLIILVLFKIFTTYIQTYFVQMCECSIGKRLIEGYLHQPYSWFLTRNSADLGKNILSEVQQINANALSPSIELIAKGMVAITISTLLIVVDPKLALIVGLTISFAYISIFYFVSKFLKKKGEERLINNRLRFTAISEAFGSVKETKVAGLEQRYIERFYAPSKIYANNKAFASIISTLPRFFLEAIVFGGILLIILYLMKQSDSFVNALPIIGLYVFAGYRLMPAIQQIYVSFTRITFAIPSVEKLYEELKNLKKFKAQQNEGIISFNKSITLKNVYYNYPNSSRTALKNLNLNIPANSSIGLVGTTGSGKSTAVDIILGLLEPQKGSLEIDGQVINNKNLRSWQRSIGYVPQHIYLSDDTIEANIAFGLEPKHINKYLVEKSSKIANLHNFVTIELPKKYETTIGERGIRLSGGQRQRIGIARALYHNPKVLILDEATSALDNQTEEAVMDAINNISNEITIILIAHRLNTVKDCDIIFKLENGKIIEEVIK